MTRSGRPKGPTITKQCERCGEDFTVLPAAASRRFCKKACSNKAIAAARTIERMTCPCGNDVAMVTDDGTRAFQFKKYCSDECRHRYAPKRAKDPANYITLTCETCDTEFERYVKRHTEGAHSFCSNPCAARWTRKVRHIGVKDTDVVLDSGYEALFYGLCCLWKIPIERADRAQAIDFKDGHYAPDFLVAGRLYVEVKGLEDEDDEERWDAWRIEKGPLVVLRQHHLKDLLSERSARAILGYLDRRARMGIATITKV